MQFSKGSAMLKQELGLRLLAAADILDTLTVDDFFNESTGRYHPVVDEVEVMVGRLEIDRAALSELYASNPRGRQCWLPATAELLAPMSAMEIRWRFGENAADERFMEGALVQAFETGTLAEAFRRIGKEIDGFSLTHD